MKVLHINGSELTLDELREAVYERRPVLLDPDARLRVLAARNAEFPLEWLDLAPNRTGLHFCARKQVPTDG